MSRALLIAWPLPWAATRTGCCAGAGHCRQGALYQALLQVSNGATRFTAVLSASQTDQLVGHWTSVHCTALYTANSLSSPGVSVSWYRVTSALAAAALWVFAQLANALP